MKGLKKRSLSMFMVLCMVIASIPQVIFATDYDNHWAKNSIAKWSEKGLVVGYEDGTFRPSNAITRGELAAILVRVFDYKDTSNAKKYTDVDNEKWYAGSVAIISAAKLMNDDGDAFRPEEPATREEAAYAIAKAYKVIGTANGKFADQADISDWASGSVEALYSQGFVSGNPDGTFAPQRTLTRADVVAMLDKITSELINLAGTYTDDVDGNLVVNTRDVVLKDMTIKGNLYLTEGIGDGDVILDNITVEGETFVNGGGLNSIKAKNSKFLESMKVSAKNPVRIVVEGDAVKIQAFPGTTVTLTGSFSDVILPPGVNVVIKDATVGKIFVQPGFAEDGKVENAVVTIEEGSTVKEVQADAPVETKGKGKIESLVVNSVGVKTEQKPVKTEVKDKDIKVEIAGKQQTKDTIVNEKPAPSGGGGGGGGSNDEPSKPSKTEHLISGKVTYKGKPVADAQVGIFSEDFDKSTHTDKNGNYSFYVQSNKTYTVNGWLVDQDRFGYYTKIEAKVANADQVVNIELEKKYVANIKVTDKSSNPIVGHLNLREVYDDNIYGSWNVDSDGYATIFLWNEDDLPKNFNIYAEDTLIGKIEGVKRGNDFRTVYTVVLDYEMEDTITGKVQYSDGKPVIGKTVYLDEIVANDRGGYTWYDVTSTVTNDKGEYHFKTPKKGVSYNVRADFQEGKNVFISQRINGLFTKTNPLVVKQAYSINVKVTDAAGIGIGAEVEVMDGRNMNGYGHPTKDDGTLLVYYKYLLPGEQVVTVTVGDKAIVKKLTIVEGSYNYDLDFEFGEIVRKPFNIELLNSSVTVGDATVAPTRVELVTADGKHKRITTSMVNQEGKTTLLIPAEFTDEKAKLFIEFGNDVMMVGVDVSLKDLNTVLKIDLAPKLASRELIGKVSITTDSAIGFTTSPSIEFDLKLGREKRSVSVKSGQVKSETTAFNLNDAQTHKFYTITVNYTVNKKDYHFEKEIYVMNDNIQEYNHSADDKNRFKDIPNEGFVVEVDSDHKLIVKLVVPK